MKRAQLNGIEVQPNTCGRLANENAERSFWQSRMTTTTEGVAPLPSLTDLDSLASYVRKAFSEIE